MAGYATYRDHMNAEKKLVLRVTYHGEGKHSFDDLSVSNISNWGSVYVQLDGHELEYAITKLGATNVLKRVVTYYGDEAKRIIANW